MGFAGEQRQADEQAETRLKCAENSQPFRTCDLLSLQSPGRPRSRNRGRHPVHLRGTFVLDWRKKQQAKADVQVTIDKILDSLPPSYTQDVYLQLCTDVFQHVYESYFGQGKSVYAMAS